MIIFHKIVAIACIQAMDQICLKLNLNVFIYNIYSLHPLLWLML